MKHCLSLVQNIHSFRLYLHNQKADKSSSPHCIEGKRNMFIAEKFILSRVFRIQKKYLVSTDMMVVKHGIQWQYDLLQQRDHIHRHHWRKSLIERRIQYNKDRRECFYWWLLSLLQNKNCKMKHVSNWLNLFQISITRRVYRTEVNRATYCVVSTTKDHSVQ
jgi:hypothetical protein